MEILFLDIAVMNGGNLNAIQNPSSKGEMRWEGKKEKLKKMYLFIYSYNHKLRRLSHGRS